MVTRPKHPSKEIEQAIIYAEKIGWSYYVAGKSAHAWGKIYCPLKAREGCKMSIFSTPRNAWVHAKQIRRRVDKCLHQSLGDQNENL